LFVTESRIQKGTEFYLKNKPILYAVSDSFSVDPFLILSIAGIESNYGVHHAQYSVFNALYTIIHRLPRKEKWAAKELYHFLKLCHENSMDPQDISGSYAGAFGFGQFIPSSFSMFSVDFDNDGLRHHLEWPDVLGSIANYLKKNGYKGTDFSKDKPIWKSVWAYNHSENYVRAVLDLRDELKKNIENTQQAIEGKD
jgi:membrane-bound lytic murein transglycosylase B